MADRRSAYRDAAQDIMETTAEHAAKIATIVSGAVVGVAREVGDLVTDGREIRDAMRRARLDEESGTATVIDAETAEPTPAALDEAKPVAPAAEPTPSEVAEPVTAEVAGAVTAEATDPVAAEAVETITVEAADSAPTEPEAEPADDPRS